MSCIKTTCTHMIIDKGATDEVDANKRAWVANKII